MNEPRFAFWGPAWRNGAPAAPRSSNRVPKTTAPKIGFVSLGCPKALVDSEQIRSQLRAEGYETAADYAGADIVVVNTCGFLDSARAESLDAIGEALAENGRVIVTGCLGAEAETSSAPRIPDVLAIYWARISTRRSWAAGARSACRPPHDPFVESACRRRA